MQKKKRESAFTLVELLGVLTLLGAILLIVVPNVMQLLSKSKNQDYERFLKDISLSAEAYIQGSSKKYSQLDFVSGKAFLKVNELVENGFLTSTKIDPSTNKKINLNGTIIAQKTPSGTITYDFVNKDITNDAYKTDGLLLNYNIASKPLTIWSDQSGTGNDGQLIGFNANNGFEGNAINLDGTNYILSKEINPNQVTLSSYLMIPVVTDAEQVLMSNYEGGGYGFVVDQFGGHKITFQINVNGTYYQINSIKDYEINRYYQLIGTYDGTTMKFYLDGELQGTKSISGTITVPQNATHFIIGGNPYGTTTSEKTKSYVSSVKIYNHALTEAEVKNDYEVDKARFGNQYDGYVEGMLAQYDSYTKPVNNTWKDLSENGKQANMSGFNNTASSGWNQDQLVLDGSDDFIQIPNVLPENKNYTIQIVFHAETPGAWTDIMTFSSGTSPAPDSVNGRIEIGDDSNQYYWFGQGPIKDSTAIFQLSNKIPAMLTMSVGTEKTTFYLNNEPTYQGTTQDYNNNQFTSIHFGKRISGRYMNCVIYAIRIYNRALTQDEVEQNYKLDQFRFGI